LQNAVGTPHGSGTPRHERNGNGTSCTSRDSSCGFVKDRLVVTAHRIRAPLATCPNDQGGGKTSARHAPTRPRLHHTEDLCHQSGGVAGRTRPEKHAPSVRPTHTHLTRRTAPTSTARPCATPCPLAPPRPATHAVPSMHAERCATPAARATRPPRPRTHARSSRRVASSRRCHPPPRQPPQAPAA
jgi:hypothetical protein